ncbi:peptidoglycan/LPS O-acetylase OafA/YrhL [Arthrobacter sp. CAN_A214]
MVSVISLIGACVFLPFSRWPTIASETIAATLYVENWWLASQSVDYSAQNTAASTVQHYWSLSVEEQFYLVWPVFLLVLFLLARRFSLGRRRVLVLGLAAVGAASLAFSTYFTYASRSEAYFVTPARVWEFAAGALVAAAAASLQAKLGRAGILAGLMQWAGFALIMLGAFSYNEETYFPGYAAVVPVLGTVLVICSGPRFPLWSPNYLLATSPIQFVGNVSYSLYLWHWPLIILLPSVINRNLTDVDKVGVAVVALLLAALSKKYIEDPGRTRLLVGGTPRRVLGWTAIAMATVCVASAAIMAGGAAAQEAELGKLDALSGGDCFGAKSLDPAHDCVDPFGPPDVENVGEDEAPWFASGDCLPHEDPIRVQEQELLSACDFSGGEDVSETVWLVGDSHAEQWQAGVFELARQHKWQVNASLMGGCPLVNVKRVAFLGVRTTDAAFQKRCLEWSAEVSDRILAERPDTVFLATFAAGETIDDGSGRSQLEQYGEAFRGMVGQWTANGTQVYVIRDTPLTLNRSTPECLSLNSNNSLACANDKTKALPLDPLAEAVYDMDEPGAKVIDLSDRFCPDDKCYAAIGGLHVFFDTDHVARSYIRSLVPLFSERFEAARAG